MSQESGFADNRIYMGWLENCVKVVGSLQNCGNGLKKWISSHRSDPDLVRKLLLLTLPPDIENAGGT